MERTAPRPVLAPPTAGAVLFGIPWTAFAIFWMAGAAGFKWPNFQGGFDFFPLFGIPFVLVGCGMLSAPLWHYRGARKTVYLISDRRAITFSGGWSTTVRGYPPGQCAAIFRRERSDGSGDLIFDRHAWRDSDGDRHSLELGFFRISNVKEVERLLKSLAADDAG